MASNLESKSSDEIKETKENPIDSEKLSEIEETSDSYEDCSLDAMKDNEGNEVTSETLEDVEDTFEDCESDLNDLEDQHPELAEEDEDYNDCGKEVNEYYVAGVTNYRDVSMDDEVAGDTLQEAYDESDDPEDMEQPTELADENDGIEVVNAEVFERPDNMYEDSAAEEYEEKKEDYEEAQNELNEQQTIVEEDIEEQDVRSTENQEEIVEPDYKEEINGSKDSTETFEEAEEKQTSDEGAEEKIKTEGVDEDSDADSADVVEDVEDSEDMESEILEVNVPEMTEAEQASYDKFTIEEAKEEGVISEEELDRIEADTKRELAEINARHEESEINYRSEQGYSEEQLKQAIEENEKELIEIDLEQKKLEEEVANRFNDVLEKERGTEEFKQALSEYNSLKDRKDELLDKQKEILNHQKELIEKRNIYEKEYIHEDSLQEEQHVEDTTDTSDDIPEEQPVEDAAETSAEMPEEQPVEDTAETSAEMPEEQPVEDTAKTSEEMSEEQPVEDTAETSEDIPEEQAIEETGGESEPVNDSAEESVDTPEEASIMDETADEQSETENTSENQTDDLSNKEYAELEDGIREITDVQYNDARELAKNDEMGRVFTDHTQDHVEMVENKSLEAANAIRESIDNGGLSVDSNEEQIGFSSEMDNKVLAAAALSHDTGMRGQGYSLTPLTDENGKQLKDESGRKLFVKDNDGKYVVRKQNTSDPDFNEIRENHSLNSALNVLSNREEYTNLGFSDSDVDRMALDCMAHSKSSSGVSDINNRSDWSDCFDRIDAAVDKYNENNTLKIKFDRSIFEGDDNELSKAASETLALRIGDVSRDSAPDAIAQSGEIVHVERDTINNKGGSVERELENANITIGEARTPVLNSKSRQVHVGEQNIIGNKTFTNREGVLTHEILVNDGTSAPECTQVAIGDHLGELGSAKAANFDVRLRYSTQCDEFSRASYEDFADRMAAEYPNVNIILPWEV